MTTGRELTQGTGACDWQALQLLHYIWRSTPLAARWWHAQRTNSKGEVEKVEEDLNVTSRPTASRADGVS